MAKTRSIFVCQDCGGEAPRWLGQCPSCGAWNSLVEERLKASSPHVPGNGKRVNGARAQRLDEVTSGTESRITTGDEELDRVLGGGIVRGSVVLVAGDPGIGKSTLMTDLGASLKGVKILYVTGEESPSQVKMRAERLRVVPDDFLLLAETDVESIISCVQDEEPDIMVVDSIQTIFRSDMQSAPGSVAQVRESAAALIHLAKSTGTSTFLVGHVTKSGSIAGPRVLEHMVDTVLYLEGDRHHVYRILRSVKNRFGSTNEIGVFEMASTGLVPVANPSELFLTGRNTESSGSTVVCSIEGTRPVLAEIQALVTPSSYSTPGRTATGLDTKRLQLLLAVLQKRGGLEMAGSDVFVNVTGGLHLSEPATDLGAAVAVISSFLDRSIPPATVVIGEIGLGGEVRAVSQLEARLREAARLGFTCAVVPARSSRDVTAPKGLDLVRVDTVSDVMDRLF